MNRWKLLFNLLGLSLLFICALAVGISIYATNLKLNLENAVIVFVVGGIIIMMNNMIDWKD